MKYFILLCTLCAGINLLGMQQKTAIPSLSILDRLSAFFSTQQQHLPIPPLSVTITTAQIKTLKKRIDETPLDVQQIIKRYLFTGPVEKYFLNRFMKKRFFSMSNTPDMSINANGTRALTGSSSLSIATLWNLDNIDDPYPHRTDIHIPLDKLDYLKLSADGRRALISGPRSVLLLQSRVLLLQLDDPSHPEFFTIPLQKNEENIVSIALSGDGKRALVGYSYGTIKLLVLDNPQQPIIYDLVGHYGAHRLQVALSLDGKKALTSTNNSILYWNLDTTDLSNITPVVLSNEENYLDVYIALNENGTRALVGKMLNKGLEKKGLELWQLHDPLNHIKTHLLDIAFLEGVSLSADGTRGTADNPSSSIVCRLEDPVNPTFFNLPKGKKTTVSKISANGNRVLSFSLDYGTTLFDLSTIDALTLWEVILVSLKAHFYAHATSDVKEFIDTQFTESGNLRNFLG